MKADSFNSPGKGGGNLESVGDTLSILEPEDTPFFSMLPKSSCSATFPEVVADTLRKPRVKGTREGKGQTGSGNKAASRQRFGVYVHRVFDEWAVTDVQQSITKKGGNAVVANEADMAEAKSVREVKRDMETISLSDLECQGGSDDEMQTRGFFKWVQATAQSVAPVPPAFLPPVNSILTFGSSDVLTETSTAAIGGGGNYQSFNKILKSMKQVYGRKINVEMFAGDDLCEMVDNFTRTSNGGDARYNVVENTAEHEISLHVSIFDSSFARVQVIPDQFVRWDYANGAMRARSAALCVKEFWEIKFLEELVTKRLDDRDGGGESGWVRGKFALLCSNPKGQGAIVG